MRVLRTLQAINLFIPPGAAVAFLAGADDWWLLLNGNTSRARLAW